MYDAWMFSYIVGVATINSHSKVLVPARACGNPVVPRTRVAGSLAFPHEFS